MSAPNIANILDRPSNTIERPKPAPQGNYVWTVMGMPRHDRSKQKQTPFVEYRVKALSAMDDVDEEALADWCKKPDGTTRTVQDLEMKLTFYVTEASAFMLKDFIEACGLTEGEDFGTIREGSEKVAGAQFGCAISHRVTDNGNVFAELKNPYKLAEE